MFFDGVGGYHLLDGCTQGSLCFCEFYLNGTVKFVDRDALCFLFGRSMRLVCRWMIIRGVSFGRFCNGYLILLYIRYHFLACSIDFEISYPWKTEFLTREL